MIPVSLINAPTAHQFDPDVAPHPLAVESAKASCNGMTLIPAPSTPILGYDQTVWGVRTAVGSREVMTGDWIVEHPAMGVFVFSDAEFKRHFNWVKA